MVLLTGRSGLDTFGVPLTLEAARDAPRSVMRGLSNGFGAIAGVPALGFFVLVGVLAAGTIAAGRGKLAPRAIAIVLAMVLQYALTGFARAQLYQGIVDYADYTRYTYVSGILALIVVGLVVGVVTVPEAGRRRLATIAVLGVWAVVALETNIGFLLGGRGLFLDRADMTRALVTVALAPDRPVGGGPGTIAGARPVAGRPGGDRRRLWRSAD